jgi:hypothetical protein
MMVFGFFLAGPMNHSWYKILDKAIPSTTTSGSLAKLAADQIVFAPIILSTFFASITVLNGGRRAEVEHVLSTTLLPALKMNYTVWPLGELFRAGVSGSCFAHRTQRRRSTSSMCQHSIASATLQ